MAHGDRRGGWRVRILSRSDGRPVGAGVLVAGFRVLTCAHVVEYAVGQQDPTARPTGTVPVDFAVTRNSAPAQSTVRADGWFPDRGDSGDLAILDLSGAPPPDAAEADLASTYGQHTNTLRVFGHPRGAPAGIWTETRIVGRGGGNPDWVQLEGLRQTGVRVEQGYSGAGVWEPDTDVVIGLIVAEYKARDAKVSWMLPMEAIAAYWQPLRPILRKQDARTGRALQLSLSELSGLADALVAVPVVRDPQSRLMLLGYLRPELAAAVSYSPQARVAVLNLLNAAQTFNGGLTELIEAVLVMDPDSEPSHALRAVAERLIGHGD